MPKTDQIAQFGDPFICPVQKDAFRFGCGLNSQVQMCIRDRYKEKKKTNPKADCLLSICDALEITPEQLLTGKGIDPEYKDEDANYEVTRSDIKILKQIHSLGDAQYKSCLLYTS